jgi:phytoene/squalene synthetase
MLAPAIRQDIYNIYGFVRFADEIVDTFHDYNKEELFNLFEMDLEKALQNKLTEHNKQMNDDDRPDWTKTTMGALKAVYRRGAGAFSTSHRPGMTRAQWAMARVNAFLYLCRTGSPENKNYVTDNDLLKPEHPKYSDNKDK